MEFFLSTDWNLEDQSHEYQLVISVENWSCFLYNFAYVFCRFRGAKFITFLRKHDSQCSRCFADGTQAGLKSTKLIVKNS